MCHYNDQLFHSSFVARLLSSPSASSVPGRSPLGYSLLEYGAGITFTLHIARVSERYLISLLPQLRNEFISKVVDGSLEGVMAACVLTLGPSAFPQEDEVEGVLKVRGGLS